MANGNVFDHVFTFVLPQLLLFSKCFAHYTCRCQKGELAVGHSSGRSRYNLDEGKGDIMHAQPHLLLWNWSNQLSTHSLKQHTVIDQLTINTFR